MAEASPLYSPVPGEMVALRAASLAALLGTASAQSSIVPAVTAVRVDGISGFTTYQVSVDFAAEGWAVQDVYALYGDPEGAALELPPVNQVAAPFGTNVGPPSALFYDPRLSHGRPPPSADCVSVTYRLVVISISRLVPV